MPGPARTRSIRLPQKQIGNLCGERWGVGSRLNKTMKTKLITVLAVGCALALPAFSFAKEKEEKEKELKSSDVPAAVQKAGEKEATGGKIVRWEKEGGNYEVVIEKNGKEWGVKIDAAGKVLSKHDESKEKSEKHDKH
jgi:hypothetical protein